MKWEYKIVSVVYGLFDDQAILNELGQEGWELVGLATKELNITYYLKRPVPTIHVADIPDGLEEAVKKVVKEHLSEVAWGRAWG